MGFNVGDAVLVLSLKKEGTVEEILKGGVYRVVVGSMSLKCTDEQIKAASVGNKKRVDPDVPQQSEIRISSDASAATLRKLDLHGVTVNDALRIVEEHISRSVLANLNEVEILHGIGSGALKKALHAHLATMPVVKRFEIKQFNPGVTRIFL